ncbi:universal stress protein [Geoglobus sp.]
MIVAAIDRRDRMERIVRFAAEESRMRGERLHIIHSMPGGSRVTREDVERAEDMLGEAELLARKHGAEVETHLLMRGNEPAKDILLFCQEVGAKLLVIGVRKRSPAGKLLFGSTAQQVILEAEIPVVCIK